ncbi:MAG: ABC transporter substrate-binding protein [Betaproteobacteria bacterium RBG_16_64_18]|nr:MAG: ABC transporter substrate-binding protein [Betaproteobacteria bacterium RBG_16_64_18]OGA12325.1 MAG: ABC transporter substrate-binding protein [Betaproteobacteria bacterium RIFCSPLOWO2_02_FULL_65_20]OGA38165.1 MAG: ABC transporter substrate-binding protein [Betaproteobacteria bacterium RIFCSPLOWO2_12_FULL_65_110]
MRRNGVHFLVAAGLALTALLPAEALAQGAIKLGELNSYKVFPAFLDPYRKGMELALEQANASGGVFGRKIEIVSRDDNGNPGDAVRVAEELLSRENVQFLMGTFASNVGLAVADFARQKKVLFIAAEPLTDKITWQSGNRYTFRLRASTYMQTAMLIPEAARLKKKRWAIVYPNYEYGQSATAAFKALLKKAQPDVEFVAEQAAPLGKIDGGAVAQALADAKPDAIFSSLFGADLARFVREGNTRGLFKGREVFNLLGGEPEYLDPLKDEAPSGWYVTGYPWYAIGTPEHKRFLDAYQKKYGDHPRLGSVVGYTTVASAVAAMKRAGSLDSEKLVAAMEGLQVDSPFGKITYRALDHQSTMGAYVGRTALKDGRGVMTDFSYADGAKFMPSDDEVRRMRPAQ